MDLRNILDIITEGEKEVKPILPEAMQGNRTSDLRRQNAKFNQKGAENTLQPMIDKFEVESLADFVKDAGFTPTYININKENNPDGHHHTSNEPFIDPDGPEDQVNEYFENTGRIDPCPECFGTGIEFGEFRDNVRICDECLGWTYLKNGRPPKQEINRETFDEVLLINQQRSPASSRKEEDEEVYSESDLGKDGKSPSVKYKDSTEADLANRMLKSKGPKGADREEADKDEGPVARELRHIRKLSGQSKIDEDELDEVIDAPTRSASNKELQDYLSRTVDKKKLKTDKYKMPYIHRSNIVNKYQNDDDKTDEPKNKNILATDKQVPIVDPEGQQYDLDKLAADITERPKRLLSQNEKMVNSDGDTIIFFNIGIPALTGLAYNEDSREFQIVNTCPGAGECKTFCYALKGGYVQWSPVSLGQTRKLNFLYNDPSGFFDQLNTEIDLENNKSLVKDDPEAQLAVRWHDAGDFFSDEYLDLAYKLADMHPNVKFYAYTKRSDVSGAVKNRPSNFLIRFSLGANKSEEKKVDFETTHHAVTVEKELFNDLLMRDGSKLVKDGKGGWQWDSPEAYEQFRERMLLKYPALKDDTLITYDEIMKKPLGDGSAFGSRNITTPKWNVIVKHGDGDDAANRGDVLGVYNLEH
jgi:hypothetical protein|tara:strand:- start:4314 stop:6242 length:1929 start_codon:yes stop_codon:yes gene_type:complete